MFPHLKNVCIFSHPKEWNHKMKGERENVDKTEKTNSKNGEKNKLLAEKSAGNDDKTNEHTTV